MPAESGHGSSVIGEDDNEVFTSDKRPLNPSNSAGQLTDAVQGSGGDDTDLVRRSPREEDKQGDIELRKRVTDASADEEELVGNDGVARRDHASGLPATGTSTPRSREERALEQAFTHPAAKTEQQTIWVPVDALGLGEEAVRDMKALKIRASNHGAHLSEKGKVDISESPPDEDAETV